MSSTSSQALEASRSDLNEPECEPSRSARSISFADKFSPIGGPIYLDLETLNASMAFPATLSPQASPARTPALDKPNGESASGSTASELDYGEKSSDWPLSYDQASSCWRTYQASFLPGLDEFSGTWPRSGMMRNGVAFLHPRPVSPIDVTASGLLPTPAARDYRDISAGQAFLSQRKRHSPSLATRLLERGVHWTMLSTAYEAAMGFPLQHTEPASRRSEIRLSRKSRKPSEEQS